MIWGAFGHDIQTDLIILDRSVNTEVYIKDILKKSNVIKLSNREYGERQWIFIQDGARPPQKKSMTYLNER